ncbi:MAG: CvpA family protein [Nitrosomonas sp.]|nr:CvpA family protein [Nitrosomonas sp.]
MTAFDYAVIGIVSVSALLSITRGLVREIVSLLAWIAAFFAASRYAVETESLLSGLIEDDSLRMLAAYAVTFFVVLLVMMMFSMLLSTLTKSVGLGLIDRMLGAIFGSVRGMVIVIALVLAAGFTPLPQLPVWQQAVLSKPLEIMAADIIPWLPAGFRDLVDYKENKM